MQNIVVNRTNAAANLLDDDPSGEEYFNGTFEEIRVLNLGYIDNVRSIYSNVRSPLESSFNLIIKLVFDTVVSLFLILFFLSWVIPILIIFIKLDSKGPAFFFQKRKKKNGNGFTCIKLHTMVVNDEADVIAAFENDSRITRFGKILRHYHLDELPQLINVLKGDMSIIGPRPYMIVENTVYENEIKEFAHRYKVKPGITGLAQSYGYFGFTNDLQKIDERVMLDLFYIKRWTFKMDMEILIRTFLSIFAK